MTFVEADSSKNSLHLVETFSAAGVQVSSWATSAESRRAMLAASYRTGEPVLYWVMNVCQGEQDRHPLTIWCERHWEAGCFKIIYESAIGKVTYLDLQKVDCYEDFKRQCQPLIWHYAQSQNKVDA